MRNIKKVVVTDYEFASLEREREILGRVGAELIATQCRSENELIRVASDADGLLNLYFGPISRRVIESLTRCKVISRYGIGVDTIDVPAATEHGIIVTNVPSYCIDEVSDHTMALILGCARKIVLLNSKVKNREWDFKISKPIFRLKGKVLGLIGFGKIARTIARKTRVFGFKLLFYDPYIPQESIKKYPAQSVSLKELLKRIRLYIYPYASQPGNKTPIG